MSDCAYVHKLNAALVFPLSIALIQCVVYCRQLMSEYAPAPAILKVDSNRGKS